MTVNLNDILWSTCGRSWGFRFVIHPDKECEWLDVYQEAFCDGQDDMNYFVRKDVTVGGTERISCVAFRFPDPESRRDEAGRMIPHEFIVFGAPGEEINSSEEGQAAVWPLVKDRYAKIYALPKFSNAEQPEVPDTPEEPSQEENDEGEKSASKGLFLISTGILLLPVLVAIAMLFHGQTPESPSRLETTIAEHGEPLAKESSFGPELVRVATFPDGYKPSGKANDWHWQPFQRDTHSESAEARQGALRLDIQSVAPDNTLPRLVYGPVALKKDVRYRTELEIRCSTESPIRLQVDSLTNGKSPNRNAFGHWDMTAGSEWKTIQHDFIPNDNVDDARLHFSRFEKGRIYEFRRVSLREIK